MITWKVPARVNSLVLILLFFLSGVTAERVAAQEFKPFRLKPPQPVYRNYSLEEGLPSPETYDVRQDKQGYIWIATDRGVVRYNGYEFKVFTEKDGLPDHVIFNLEEDPQGRIWFVSYNGLLSYYEKGKIVRYKYNHIIKKYIGGINPTFKSFKIDQKGNLYYAIQTIGTLKITPEGVATNYHLQNNRSVVWITKIDGDWFPSADFSQIPKDAMYHMVHKPVYKHVGGKSWKIATDNFANRLDIASEKGRSFLLLDNKIMNLETEQWFAEYKGLLGIRLANDKLFAGIYIGGVIVENLRLPKNHPNRKERLLDGLSVTSVWVDREGGYWFSTLENGVYYTPNLSFRSYTKEEGLPQERITQVIGYKDRMMCSYYGGFIQISPSHRIMKDMIADRLFSAIGATENKLYFGSSTRLENAYVKDDYIFIPCFNDIWPGKDYILVVSDKVARISDDGKASMIYGDLKRVIRTSYTTKPVDFQAVIGLKSGQIFVGNLHGLYEIRDRNPAMAHLRNPIFRKRVSDLAEHPCHGVIAATRGYGIYFFNPKTYKITQVINRASGLLNDHVNCLYVDKKGRIYVGTNEGLSIIEFSNGRFSIHNVTNNQGLCSNRINSIYVKNDVVWLATMKGITRFSFSEIEKPVRGTIRLEYLATDQKQYERGNYPYRFDSDTPLIRLELRTDNFKGSPVHRFKYQLRENGPWIPTDVHEIVINDPGYQEYYVRVKFMNEEGKWSAPVLVAHFEIQLPLYLRWYILLLEGLILLALIGWLIRVIVNRVKRRHYYETKISQLEQKALAAQMNPHFIFNSLNSIQSFLIFGENEKAEHYLLKFSSLIRQTLNNSREKYIRIEQEIKTLKDYLELEQMRFKHRFSFEIQSHLSGDIMQCYIPPMLVQPYVENAILHGVSLLEKDGKITIVFTVQDEMLRITIDDNGTGRQLKKAKLHNHRSYGTTITEERLALLHRQLGQSFRVETIDKSENGKSLGTRVELSIPLMQQSEISESEIA